MSAIFCAVYTKNLYPEFFLAHELFSEGSAGILDMQCVMEVNRDYPVLAISRGLGIQMPGLLLVLSDSFDLLLFVPKNFEYSRDMRIFLEKFKASDIGAMWVIRASSRDHAPLENFRLITDIPSSVIDGVIISGGSLKVYVRFNHRYADYVSRAILEASDRKTGAVPQYLGKSKGRDYFLREISSAINLDLITISSLPPEAEKNKDRNPVPAPWVREVRYLSESGINAVYQSFSETGSADGKDDGRRYYEARTENPVLEAITSKAASLSVPTYSIVQGFDGNIFKMEFAVPSDYSSRFLKIVSEVDSRFPKWIISITGIIPFLEK